MEEIKGQLQDKGYTVSYTEGYAFVLKGIGIKEALPENWYAEEKPAQTGKTQGEENIGIQEVEPEYADILLGEQNLAVSQNKVYQIGDKNNQKKVTKWK